MGSVTVTYVGGEQAIQHKPPAANCDPIQFYRGTPVDLAAYFVNQFAPSVPRYVDTLSGVDEDGEPVMSRRRVGTESGALSMEQAGRLAALVKVLADWYENEVRIAHKVGGLSNWEVRRTSLAGTRSVRTATAERHEALKKVLAGTMGSVIKWLESAEVDDGLVDLVEQLEKEGQGRKGVLTHLSELRQKLRRGESPNPVVQDVDAALDEMLDEESE